MALGEIVEPRGAGSRCAQRALEGFVSVIPRQQDIEGLAHERGLGDAAPARRAIERGGLLVA